MQKGNIAEYDDYSGHNRLREFHRLMRIRTLPLPGIGKIASLLTKLLPYPKPSGGCIVKTIHGFRLIVDPIVDKGVEKSIFFNGTYEEGTMRVIGDVLTERACVQPKDASAHERIVALRISERGRREDVDQ